MTTQHAPIQLANTLFAYVMEWNSGQYSLEQLMAKGRELGFGPGLEIVGFQSLRGYPYLSPSAVYDLKALMDKYEYEPACLGANLDVAIRRDRMMTTDEMVDYLTPQIEMARQLGFPVLRLQVMAKPDVVRRLVPVAEKASVKLGMELHTPYSVDHPAVVTLRELYAELDTPCLGFIPDCGTSMRAIPDALLNSFREAGVTDEQLSVTREIWYKDVPTPEKFGELHERIAGMGGTPAQIGRLNMAFSMCGRQPVERWREIVPQTIHVHGKFYGIDETGAEPSVDYPAILRLFYEEGYTGYICSEYEGSAFTDEFSSFERVAKHHALCRRILAELAQQTVVGNALNQPIQ